MSAPQILTLALGVCALVVLAVAVRWTRQAARDRQRAALLLASTQRRRRASRRW